MVESFVGNSVGFSRVLAMGMGMVMADVLHGFNYFVRFGTAARPDHAIVPRLEYLSYSSLVPRATG